MDHISALAARDAYHPEPAGAPALWCPPVEIRPAEGV